MTKTLIAAALGGMLPTLCRLAASYAVSPNQPAPAAGVYLALGIFSVIGMMVAYGFEESVVKNPFVLGIAAPGVVTSIFSGAVPSTAQGQQARVATASGKAHVVSAILELVGVGRVDAQNSVSANMEDSKLRGSVSTGPARKLIVKPTVTSAGWASSVPVELMFLTKNGAALNQVAVISGHTSTVIVPPGAASVEARSAASTTVAPLPLTDFQSAVLTLRVKARPSNDFLWALGGARGATVSGISSNISDIKAVTTSYPPTSKQGTGNSPAAQTVQPQAHEIGRGKSSRCKRGRAAGVTRPGCTSTQSSPRQ